MSKLSMLALGVIGTVLGLAGSAWAQQPVQVIPSPGTTAGGQCLRHDCDHEHVSAGISRYAAPAGWRPRQERVLYCKQRD